MALTVKALRDIPSLASTQVLAGAAGLANPIENIVLATSQMSLQRLPVHEVLTISLTNLYQLMTTSFDHLIEKLVQKRCSALLVHRDQFTAILPDPLLAACDQQALPLIDLPAAADERDIFVDITQALYVEKKRQLDYYNQINRHFASLTQSNSRQSLIDTLAGLIHNPVFLCQLTEHQIRTTLHSATAPVSTLDLDWAQRASLSLPGVNGQGYSWSPADERDAAVIALPVFEPATSTLYLAIQAQNQALQESDFPTIESAINFLQLIISQQAASHQNRQAYTNDLIDDLLNGQLTTPDRYHNTLRQLKLDSNSAYRVLLIQAQSNGHALADYFSKRPTISRQLIHLLKSHWPDLRYRIRSDHLTFIFRDQAPAQADLKEALAQLPVEAETIYYHAGVGTAQLPNRLNQSASEALKTIQLMERLVPHAALRTFTGLGFYRCLPTPDHPRDLQSLVPENLWSLNQRHPELYQTLVAYIQHNLSVKQGAAALFIHPKTMSYRLRKLRELLQTDFTDAEELFTFNVGIHVLRLLDQPAPVIPLDSL